LAARRLVILRLFLMLCAQIGLALAGLVLAAMAPVRAQPGQAQPSQTQPSHALAMHGAPALPPDFTHFPYANPDAPQGGRLTLGMQGTFDTLNPFVVKGLPLPAIRGYVVESLMARGYDEPFTLYGLLASGVETDEARSFVAFTLDPDAKFSDGQPVTAEDVLFSWALLRDHGRPNLQGYYRKVTKAEATGPRTVRFDLAGSDDRELPLILGLMPILPKHATNTDTFEDTSFTAPMGSGPYVVGAVDPGRSVTLKRNPAYWGRARAVNRGLWNFDEVRFDYYRDGNAFFEAFKKGLVDIRVETDPTRWHDGYDIPALRDGRIVKEDIATGLPAGMRGFVFNTRRAIFADVRVREAVTMLFDFAWINRNLFFDLYRRPDSYFSGSVLASTGRPADARERALLAPYPGAVRADILDGTWTPPRSDGSGRDRAVLRKALALLSEAGYRLDGAQLRFESLVTTRDQERIALLYAQQLERAGIVARVRMVDAVQFDRRKLTFDFDMIENLWDESLSPGNEQAFYWSSDAAKQEGSRNYMGAQSPAIDAMIAALLTTHERADFVSTARALDRVLLSGYYVVPTYYLPAQWVAHSAAVTHPASLSVSGYLPETWWRKTSPGNGGAHDPR
jgi:peptide/nickel transport system substrate-binding protein